MQEPNKAPKLGEGHHPRTHYGNSNSSTAPRNSPQHDYSRKNYTQNDRRNDDRGDYYRPNRADTSKEPYRSGSASSRSYSPWKDHIPSKGATPYDGSTQWNTTRPLNGVEPQKSDGTTPSQKTRSDATSARSTFDDYFADTPPSRDPPRSTAFSSHQGQPRHKDSGGPRTSLPHNAPPENGSRMSKKKRQSEAEDRNAFVQRQQSPSSSSASAATPYRLPNAPPEHPPPQRSPVNPLPTPTPVVNEIARPEAAQDPRLARNAPGTPNRPPPTHRASTPSIAHNAISTAPQNTVHTVSAPIGSATSSAAAQSSSQATPVPSRAKETASTALNQAATSTNSAFISESSTNRPKDTATPNRKFADPSTSPQTQPIASPSATIAPLSDSTPESTQIPTTTDMETRSAPIIAPLPHSLPAPPSALSFHSYLSSHSSSSLSSDNTGNTSASRTTSEKTASETTPLPPSPATAPSPSIIAATSKEKEKDQPSNTSQGVIAIPSKETSPQPSSLPIAPQPAEEPIPQTPSNEDENFAMEIDDTTPAPSPEEQAHLPESVEAESALPTSNASSSAAITQETLAEDVVTPLMEPQHEAEPVEAAVPSVDSSVADEAVFAPSDAISASFPFTVETIERLQRPEEPMTHIRPVSEFCEIISPGSTARMAPQPSNSSSSSNTANRMEELFAAFPEEPAASPYASDLDISASESASVAPLEASRSSDAPNRIAVGRTFRSNDAVAPTSNRDDYSIASQNLPQSQGPRDATSELKRHILALQLTSHAYMKCSFACPANDKTEPGYHQNLFVAGLPTPWLEPFQSAIHAVYPSVNVRAERLIDATMLLVDPARPFDWLQFLAILANVTVVRRTWAESCISNKAPVSIDPYIIPQSLPNWENENPNPRLQIASLNGHSIQLMTFKISRLDSIAIGLMDAAPEDTVDTSMAVSAMPNETVQYIQYALRSLAIEVGIWNSSELRPPSSSILVVNPDDNPMFNRTAPAVHYKPREFTTIWSTDQLLEYLSNPSTMPALPGVRKTSLGKRTTTIPAID